MPVEIRELVIKTEVQSTMDSRNKGLSDAQTNLLKQHILKACKRSLHGNKANGTFNR